MARVRMFRRFATLLMVLALLAAPAVTGAAPASTDSVATSWSLSWQGLWQGLSGIVASWFDGGEPSSVTGAAELGSTLDPDGSAVASTPDGGTEDGTRTTWEPAPAPQLGSTLDPDG